MNCENEKTAAALGFFDGLHLGHIEVIKQTLIQKDKRPVVFTFSDRSILPKQGKKENIITFGCKLELLGKMGVSSVYAPDFDEVKDLSPEEFFDSVVIKKLNAGFVACGYDFHFGKGGAGTAETLKKLCEKSGVEITVVPPVKVDGQVVSSTLIREFIRNGDIARANRFLGYELTYRAEVVKGRKIGRTIGFPTINQIIPDGMTVPRSGVYKSWTEVSGKNYSSVTNIGIRPTIALDAGEVRKPIAETHIIGFEGDLYGEKIRIFLRDFVREERKFDSLDALREQIDADKKSVSS